MAMTIRTRDGDFLDDLCHAYYGRLEGTMEAVLQANRGLSMIRQPYSAGVEMTLPDIAVEDTTTVTLWD